MKKALFLAVLCFFCSLLLFTQFSYAAHPLITDDTGTAGKGKMELEVGTEYGHDDEEGVKENSFEIVPVLTYGIMDNVDIEIAFPYLYTRTKEAGTTDKESGFSDVEIDLKWRFYEKDGLSFAIRPLVSFPTGDDEKGLGTGKVTYSLLLFVTKEISPWAFDLNLGYARSENKLDERENIWHASLATRYEAKENLVVVGDIGLETNPDKESDTPPAYLLGGIIYTVLENIDVDFAVKGGLTDTEVDYALLAGMTFRF